MRPRRTIPGNERGNGVRIAAAQASDDYSDSQVDLDDQASAASS